MGFQRDPPELQDNEWGPNLDGHHPQFWTILWRFMLSYDYAMTIMP